MYFDVYCYWRNWIGCESAGKCWMFYSSMNTSLNLNQKTAGLRKTNHWRRRKCSELETGYCTLSFSRNLLLSAATRDMTLKYYSSDCCFMNRFSAENRRKKSMCKARSYYCGWMRGDEYEPQGIHWVLMCYQHQHGCREEEYRKRHAVFGLRGRIWRKGWVLPDTEFWIQNNSIRGICSTMQRLRD